jgi:hypothetical protein
LGTAPCGPQRPVQEIGEILRPGPSAHDDQSVPANSTSAQLMGCTFRTDILDFFCQKMNPKNKFSSILDACFSGERIPKTTARY